jgi:hypothetical protein
LLFSGAGMMCKICVKAHQVKTMTPRAILAALNKFKIERGQRRQNEQVIRPQRKLGGGGGPLQCSHFAADEPLWPTKLLGGG